MERVEVLDKGYVDFMETFGNELTIVNAARVSFDNYHETMTKRDTGLIKYLYRNGHMSPFRHVILRVRIHAPEVVMRQLYKHVVGIEATASGSVKDHSWSELSGRYRPVKEYYYPDVWRRQSEDNKQASYGSIHDQELATKIYNDIIDKMEAGYKKLLELGVAKEQARLLLPISQYTTVIWTASLQAMLNFISLRDHDHAQFEIREYAKVFNDFIKKEFPTVHEIFTSTE